MVLLLAACSSANDSVGEDRSDGTAAAPTAHATDGTEPTEPTEPTGDDSDDSDDATEPSDDGSTRGDDDGGDPNAEHASTPPGPMPTVEGLVRCPAPTVTVADTAALHDALAAAEPGDVIALAPGRYRGKFVAANPATTDRPIFVCGPRDAVIDGEGIKGGYAFHLDGASAWRLVGFTVRNAQKGVVADHVDHVIIEGLLVEDIGDEAIHLRTFSTDSIVIGNEIRDTGQRRAKFGEGIYVGSAESNWCAYTDCEPDRSDRNLIVGNLIYGTTAESIDIKEGTTAGVVRSNSFSGSALSGADSWVDVKGTSWIITDNVGVDSPQDGFQMHQILEGWGASNEFARNTATVNGPGYGFAVTNTEANVVRCDNVVTDAAAGFADIECSA